MATTITTSTAATATAYSNQRKVDRCQNGVLWSMFWDGTSTTTTSMDFYYSTDDGATWTKGGEFGFAGTGTTYTPNASFFIDLDDYAHLVYKDRHDGYLYYRRGTPNAGRTAWTWSAAQAVETGFPSANYPDVVATREGTGWKAHILYAIPGSAVFYHRLGISSGGAFTKEVDRFSGAGGGGQVGGLDNGSGDVGYPSIDFNHTGDGKTVAGGTPHLYVAWSRNFTGSPNGGIRFKKATYSGGTWTWGTEREIDSTVYVDSSSGQKWLNCLFDGTRVIIGGNLYETGSTMDTVLHERDAADTTTTTRVLVNSSNSGLSVMQYGSLSYDSVGNVYFLGLTYPGGGAAHIGYRKWDRASGIFESQVGMATIPNASNIYASVKRGYSSGRIEFIYTDGTASPYSVVYDSISLNTPPTAPTLSPASGTKMRAPVTSWTHNDPDSDPQGGWGLVRKKVIV